MGGPSSFMAIGILLQMFSAIGASPLNSTLESRNRNPEKGDYFTISTGWGHLITWQLNNARINACNGEFLIGQETCTSCPSGSERRCDLYNNETIIDEDGNMGAAVPGGQRYYISQEDEDYGALLYTRPGDGTQSSTLGEFYNDDGELKYSLGEDPDEWLACPVRGQERMYKVFMQLVNGRYSDCKDIDIHIGEKLRKNAGAYQYW